MSEAWDQYEEGAEVPSKATLRNWRRRADRLADKQGASGACHLCKRPTGYRRGTVELYAPKAYNAKPYRLRLCRNCYDLLHQFLDRLQVELKHDRWPVDE